MSGKASGRPWRLQIAAGVLCAAAAPAAAVTTGTASLGTPTAAVPDGLTLTATGEMLYDSNLRRIPASALLSGGHTDDFRYSPAGKLTYNRSVGRLSLTADGLAGRDFFQYNSGLDKNHYLADGVVTYHSGASCQAAANGSYSSRLGGVLAGSEGIDPTTPPDDVGQVINNLQTSAIYGLNANCGSPSARLSFGAGYSHSSLRNGSFARKFADSDGDTYNGSIGVGIFRPGQLWLNGSYSTIDYPHRLATPGVVLPPQLLSTGVKTYRIGLALSRPIGPRLSGTLGVSYLHANPAGGQPAYSSPAYNVGLTYTAGPRLSFVLNGSRDIIASTSAGALYRVVDQVVFAANYSLGQSITIDANLGLIHNDYKESFAILGEPARRSELSKTGGIGVTYAPRPLYDVTLSVTRTMRTSDPSVLNYNSTKAGIVLAIHI